MKNKILITGGAGFIGSNFVKLIVKNSEDQIFVLDKLTYAGNLKNLEAVSDLPNYNFIKGDICDKELIESIFEEHQFNKVVHFAAESHVDNSITGPSTFIQTNIVGTFNLLHSAYCLWMTGPNHLKKSLKVPDFYIYLRTKYMEHLEKQGYLLKIRLMPQIVLIALQKHRQIF